MDFEMLLKSLPNVAGRKLYFFECALGYINYDEIHHRFQKLIDGKGYRPFSLSYIKDLTITEKDEIELDIKSNTFVFTEYDMHTKKRTILYNGFKEQQK